MSNMEQVSEIDNIVTKLRAGLDPDTRHWHITEDEAIQAISNLITKARIEELEGELICQSCNKKTTYVEATTRIYQGNACGFCGGALVKDIGLIRDRISELRQSLIDKDNV